LAAWGLRLYRLDFQDIWWDEARNIDVATRAFSHIATAPELDIHPPLYFYLLHFWTSLAGASPFSTRFLSVWFGVLTLALVYQLARQLLPRQNTVRLGLLALIIAAAAPFALAEAQETRMYTVSWALLAAAMLALWSALRAGPQKRLLPERRWLIFAVLTAAALLTHYATVFVLVTWGLWLLGWALFSAQRWSRLRTLAGVAMVVGILFLPVVPIALRQIPGYDNPNLVLPDLAQYFGQLDRAFTLGDFAPDSFWQWGRWLWLGVIAMGGASWFWRREKGEHNILRLGLLATWLFGSLIVFYLILVTRAAFNPRYISFILPALWALSAWALAGWRKWGRAWPWLAGLGLVALSVPGLHADLFDPSHFREDMRGVVGYLRTHATPDDIILVDQRYPFGFYWQRWNNDFYGTPPSEPSSEPPAQYLFVDLTHEDQRRIDRRLTLLAGEARHVYYVTWFESDMDPRGAVPALLNTAGSQIDEVFFRGYTVRVWELTPPTTFQLAEAFTPLDIEFEQGIRLVEGDWSGRVHPLEGQGSALVTLRWQVQAPTSQSFKVSVRLKDASGATLAQDDRLLLSDRHLRTPAWQANESAINVYSLPLPSQAGQYTITLVVYDETTLAAIGVSDGSGIEPVIGQLTVAGQ